MRAHLLPLFWALWLGLSVTEPALLDLDFECTYSQMDDSIVNSTRFSCTQRKVCLSLRIVVAFFYMGFFKFLYQMARKSPNNKEKCFGGSFIAFFSWRYSVPSVMKRVKIMPFLNSQQSTIRTFMKTINITDKVVEDMQMLLAFSTSCNILHIYYYCKPIKHTG